MARIRLNLLLSAAYHGFKTGKGADHLIVMGVSPVCANAFQRQPQAAAALLRPDRRFRDSAPSSIQ